MSRHLKRAVPTGVVALLLMLPAMTWGAETRFALAGTAVITDGAGASRVLLDFGDLTSALTGELVTSAILEIQLPGAAPDTSIAVEVSAVETAWAGRAPTWTTPWVRAGGDIGEVPSAIEILGKGVTATNLTFDVTEVVRAVADGDSPPHGFLLSVPEYKGTGIRTADMTVVGSVTGAELRVTHRNISRLGHATSKDLVKTAGSR
jgi:hypothetical protein